jgi:hypothetical protein
VQAVSHSLQLLDRFTVIVHPAVCLNTARGRNHVALFAGQQGLGVAPERQQRNPRHGIRILLVGRVNSQLTGGHGIARGGGNLFWRFAQPAINGGDERAHTVGSCGGGATGGLGVSQASSSSSSTWA